MEASSNPLPPLGAVRTVYPKVHRFLVDAQKQKILCFPGKSTDFLPLPMVARNAWGSKARLLAATRGPMALRRVWDVGPSGGWRANFFVLGEPLGWRTGDIAVVGQFAKPLTTKATKETPETTSLRDTSGPWWFRVLWVASLNGPTTDIATSFCLEQRLFLWLFCPLSLDSVNPKTAARHSLFGIVPNQEGPGSEGRLCLSSKPRASWDEHYCSDECPAEC